MLFVFGNLFLNSTKEVDIYNTALLAEQCLHKISGIRSLSTKLVDFIAKGIVLHLYCFSFIFIKRLHLELVFQKFYSFCHVFKDI